MKKRRYLLLFTIVAIVIIGIAAFAGCQKENEDDSSLDVTVMVSNSLGDKWIFTPDIEELSVEYAYTGQEIAFKIAKFRIMDMKGQTSGLIWGDSLVSGQGFNWTCVCYDLLDGTYHFPEGDVAKERGKYVYEFYGSGGFRYRSFRLVVIIN